MVLPNFLVIGTARAGTSALTAFLQRHPQIFIPCKEPNYFSGWNSRKTFDGPRAKDIRPELRCGTLEQYTSLFAESQGFKARGEASVSYLPDADAPELIRETIPDVALIAILRQPAERAFAHFHLQRFHGQEPASNLLEALDQERRGMRRNWCPTFRYLEFGRYAEQLRRYQAVFPTDQLSVYLTDDWRKRPAWVWRQILDTLEVRPDFTPDFSERHAPTRTASPAWRLLQRTRRIWPMVPRIARSRVAAFLRARLVSYPTLSRALRNEVTERYFRDEILRLEEVLGSELPDWRPN